MAKRKKSYYKKRPQKGVRYVNRALKKYFTKRYPNYQDRMQRSRELVSQIKAADEKVILKNIFALERRHRKPSLKKQKEDLLAGIEDFLTDSQQALFRPDYYFNLDDYPARIISLPKSMNITFVSEISPAGVPDIQAGDNVMYHEYFADFVNYCNKLKRLADQQGAKDEYNSEWFVKCTEPSPDASGRMISRIISCDSDGNIQDYGFDSNKPTESPDQYIPETADVEYVPEEELPEEPTPRPEPSAPKVTPEEIQIKEIERDIEIAKAKEEQAKAEQKKAETINKALDMLMEGKISHSQFDAIVGAL